MKNWTIGFVVFLFPLVLPYCSGQYQSQPNSSLNPQAISSPLFDYNIEEIGLGGGTPRGPDPGPGDDGHRYSCTTIPEIGIEVCKSPRIYAYPSGSLAYGPGSKFTAGFDLRAAQNLDVSAIRPFLSFDGSIAVRDTMDGYCGGCKDNQSCYDYIPLEGDTSKLRLGKAPQEVAPRKFRFVVNWFSNLDTPPGNYRLGLQNVNTGAVLAEDIVTFKVHDSQWMRVYGDDDNTNIKIVVLSDQWDGILAYRDATFKMAENFIDDDPIVKNYSPSITIDAKVVPVGLRCGKCEEDGRWNNAVCGADPHGITGVLAATAIAMVLVDPFLASLPLFLIDPEDLADRLVRSREDLFMCRVDSIRLNAERAPKGADYIVAFTAGVEDANSHVGAHPENHFDLAYAILTSNLPDSDIIFLRHQGSDYANGTLLLRLFGASFASVPDFYIENDPVQCGSFYGRMCNRNLRFASPRPPGWDENIAGPNNAFGAIKMINEFNKRVGEVERITTGEYSGYTFPNPNPCAECAEHIPDEDYCTGRSFQAHYRSANPKQYSYITARIADFEGKIVYEWASTAPVPPADGVTLSYFGYPNGVPSNPGILGPYVGLGYHGLNMRFEPIASGVYFFSLRHGDIMSDEGISQKFTWFNTDRNLLPSNPICSPQ